MLQAEITYATTAQHAKQHWPSSVYLCTVHLKGKQHDAGLHQQFNMQSLMAGTVYLHCCA